MSSNKMVEYINSLQKKAGRQKKWGIVFIIWNALLFITALTPDDETAMDIYIALLCIFGGFVLWGVWLCYLSHNNTKHIMLYHEYKFILRGERDALELNYEGLGKTLNKSAEEVRKEIIFFTKHGMWESIHGGEDAVLSKEKSVEKAEKMATQKMRSLTCDSCKATTTVNIYEMGAVCAYCASPLVEELRRVKYQ